MIEFKVHHSVEAFRNALRVFAEPENSLLLGRLARSPGSFMAEVRCGGRLTLAAYYHDLNLVLAGAPGSWPRAAEALAAELHSRDLDIPAVAARADVADDFASAWVRAHGAQAELAYHQRIYRLSEVIWPPPCPGRMRPMAPADWGILQDWLWQFHVQALDEEPYTEEEAGGEASSRMQEHGTYFWEVDGQPRAMASLARPTEQTISINAVFTPESERRHGYGSALVAHLSAEGLSRGKLFCVLYADLKNPTSNSIYQKMGYESVCDSRYYRFL